MPPATHRNPAVRFEDAIASGQRGDTAHADAICVELLDATPSHADAWHLRGLLAFQCSQFERGIEFIRQSLTWNEQQPAAHTNIGNALLELKQPAQALAHFEQAVALNPASATALYGRGSALLQLQHFEAALADFDRALLRDATLVPALHGRSLALQRLGRVEQALNCTQEALRLSPDNVDVLRTHGNLLFELRRFEDALTGYNRALQVTPLSVELLNNRGNTLRELCRQDAALESFDRALALDGAQAEAHSNRGNVLLEQGRGAEALVCYQLALELRPEFPEALDNQGLALLQADRPLEAVRSYERLLGVAPQFDLVRSNLLQARAMCCDWNNYPQDRAELIASIEAGTPVHPFPLLAICDSAARLGQAAERFLARRWPVISGRSFRHPCNRQRAGAGRLRIAYVSADLRQHAVSTLMSGVWERHDRSRFETIAISLRPEDTGAVGRRIRGAFERFVDVSQMSDREAADLMRRLEVDVAVDLMGFTRGCRPGIFSHRAAPVQTNFLGYAGTTGAPYMDYILADAVVTPAGQESHYREQVVRLPHSYLPHDDRRELGARPSRSEAGLPDEGFVFCAFTNAYKINPPVFEVWMRLLRDTPHSVLWLRGVGEEARRNLQREAEQRRIDGSRLVFAPHVAGMAEHLARQSLADLYLDTLPYNAHSSAVDALWAGVPVLTCAGGSFASRVASSALTAVGLEELITQDLEQYQRRGLELARDPEQLRSLRERLERARSNAPLFDTVRYTRDLERAYLHMHERAVGGQAPARFDLAPQAV
jgi:protein O-GlcNAc transferase